MISGMCSASICWWVPNMASYSVAQALADVHDLIYAVKVQQPKGDWAKIYGKAECVFEAPLLLGESESEAESEIHSAFIHEVEQYVRHFTGMFLARHLAQLNLLYYLLVSARLWMPKLMEEYTDLQVELIAI